MAIRQQEWPNCLALCGQSLTAQIQLGQQRVEPIPSPTQNKGYAHETAAASLLEDAQLVVIARNYTCRFGELDIVATNVNSTPPRLHFVEVRYRKSDRFGGAAASVTLTKQHKVRRTAELFLQRHNQFRNFHCQFDVITVTGTNYPPDMHWIEDAF